MRHFKTKVWTFILIQPLGADEQSGTFMLFVMLLVVAISSMLGSSLPIAVLAPTLPVTIAIALDFVLRGTLHDYILPIRAAGRQSMRDPKNAMANPL